MADDDEPLRRIARVPRRASPTGTSFDFVRMEILCPKCNKEGSQPLAELVVNDLARCPYCGFGIDISSVELRAKISERAEIHKKIKPL